MATGFLPVPVVTGVENGTDFAFAPDGRIFVAIRTGEVVVYKNGVLADTFIDLPDVNSSFFRGLIGLALDPNFETNGYVYLYYVHENDVALPQAPKTARLIRVTANGNTAVPGSEVVILGSVGGSSAAPSCDDMAVGVDCIPADGVDHFGGGLVFAPDGTLYLSTGDAAANSPRVQDLDLLAGKVLRINADGTAYGGNPFHTGDPNANRSKVWAFGFRNPFRLDVQPATSLPVLGDVGTFYWEEINVVEPELNYGWPCYEGTAPQPLVFNSPFCTAFYQTGTTTEHPAYHYANLFAGGGSAVIAGVFYDGLTYPSEFHNTFIFGDFVRGWIKALPFDADNEAGEAVETVLTDAGNPVDFEMGNDGDVYYLTQGLLTGSGDIFRIVYQPGNRPPIASASANPRGGLTSLQVDFSSEGSNDPEGAGLSYLWDFDDGDVSTEPNPSHKYPTPGTYDVQLTVEDAEGATATASVSVVAGNELPAAFIDSPGSGMAYSPGQVVTLSGHGTDLEDGSVPNARLTWNVSLHHCEPLVGGCHSHLYSRHVGLETAIVTPDQGIELYFLEITLTATDSVGLQGTASVVIGPDADNDGARDQDELFVFGTDRLDPDTDDDGCMDGAELGPNPELGGQRDPLDFWDFYDTPSNGGHDGVVDLFNDFFGVVFRFGAEDAGGTAPINRDSDPMSVPPPDPAYHPGFDRSPPAPGAPLWDMGPPDGSIDLFNDILGIVVQHGHTCNG